MSWLTSDESVTRYIDALKRATSDDEVFCRFRREPGVREIVEGVPDVVGQGYHAKLTQKIGADVLALEWERVTRNDKVGDPQLVTFPEGVAASTTMRYFWNVVDMERHGVALNDVDIVEVGGGYGGLCRMIYEFHSPRSYTIIDLPEALTLAEKYLAQFEIKPRLESCYSYYAPDVDTFISNYALTELTKDVQDTYVDKVMRHAKHGYVTYNSQPRNATQQYSLDELKSFVIGDSVVEEENVKKSECKVLIWRPE